MSTADQLLGSELHGAAMRYAAERRVPRRVDRSASRHADGRTDILAEVAGITAGSWYVWPSTHIGHELIAAGMMILAGGGRGLPLDYDELERWTRVGFERGTEVRLTVSAGNADSGSASGWLGTADHHSIQSGSWGWRYLHGPRGDLLNHAGKGA